MKLVSKNDYQNDFETKRQMKVIESNMNWILAELEILIVEKPYPSTPTTKEFWDYMEETINDEIHSCKMANNIENTDYDHFLFIKDMIKVIRKHMKV